MSSFFLHNFWRKVLFSYRNKDDVAVVDFFFLFFVFKGLLYLFKDFGRGTSSLSLKQTRNVIDGNCRGCKEQFLRIFLGMKW